MSTMTERGEGQTKVFIGAAVATLIAVALFALFMGPAPTPPEPPPTSQVRHPATRIEEESLYLYFAERDGTFLTSEEHSISAATDPWQLSRKIIAGLIEGPERGSVRTLPATTHLRALYIMEPKTAVVDFSREISEEPMSASAELLAVYSVVNSLAVNSPEIDSVLILIEGRPAETLSGHIDISEPLTPDTQLVR